MVISSSTMISDSVLFIRDLLKANILDPLDGKRSLSSKFIVTSYPLSKVEYPIISVKHSNFNATPMGQASDQQLVRLDFEVRVWARNVKERDELSQEVYDLLRTKQFTVITGTITNELLDFNITSAVDVDEATVKSKVIMARYMFITQ
jgi:hypothetical protein